MSATATMEERDEAAPAAGAPRVGRRITLGARVVGTIPDGTAAVVRVYDRGRGDGERVLATLQGKVRDRAVAVPWTVVGRPGYRAHELQLEFDVEAGGKRTPRTPLRLARERLVEVEISAGAGSLDVDADVPFHVIETGKAADRPTFGTGQRFRAEVPQAYQGKIVVRQGGRALATVDVGRLPLGPDDPVRVRAAAVTASAGAMPGWPLPSTRVPADATAVARRGAPGAGGVDESVHVHPINGRSPLADGAHELHSLGDQAYKWFIVQVFGSSLPPAIVSLVQSKEILREFGTTFYIKDGRYIIFRGSPRARQYLTGTRYKVDHPKVLLLTGGGRIGAAKALADGAKGSVVALVIVGALDVIEGWQKGSAWEDILVDVVSDTVKGLLGTAIGVGLLAGVAIAAPALVAAVPVGVVVAAGIALGVVIGLGLDALDSRIGATDALRRGTHSASSWIAEVWQDLVVEPVGRAMVDLENNILDLYQVPRGIRR